MFHWIIAEIIHNIVNRPLLYKVIQENFDLSHCIWIADELAVIEDDNTDD